MPTRAGGIYNWVELFDGSLWKLTPGEYLSASSFRSAAYQAGERHGVSVRVSVRNMGTADEHILVQAAPRA